MNVLKKAAAEEDGQGFAEYAFIFLLVVLVVMGTLTPVGAAIEGLCQQVVAVF